MKNKVHSFINITGLSVGMAVAILIGLWIWDEVTYDRYFKNQKPHCAEYCKTRTLAAQPLPEWSMPVPTAATIRDNYGSYFK